MVSVSNPVAAKFVISYSLENFTLLTYVFSRSKRGRDM